ncbi:MAG: DUF177 domain-containing protein [Bacteroidia bacterium]|nr:DUF177 domain-containing protein [Bacteroidia bacterium]
MAIDRTFEQQYSLDIAMLVPGKQAESFSLDRAFFEHFDFGLSQDGNVKAELEIVRYPQHFDVVFHIKGNVKVECDRCLEPYDQPIDSTNRIIYSYDPNQQFEDTEVIQINEEDSEIPVAQDLYDFVHVSLPLRRVPSKKIHICDPSVLAVLGLDANGKPLPKEESEDDIDPRWEALKKLKDSEENS